jgi:hypothetical protein
VMLVLQLLLEDGVISQRTVKLSFKLLHRDRMAFPFPLKGSLQLNTICMANA